MVKKSWILGFLCLAVLTSTFTSTLLVGHSQLTPQFTEYITAYQFSDFNTTLSETNATEWIHFADNQDNFLTVEIHNVTDWNFESDNSREINYSLTLNTWSSTVIIANYTFYTFSSTWGVNSTTDFRELISFPDLNLQWGTCNLTLWRQYDNLWIQGSSIPLYLVAVNDEPEPTSGPTSTPEPIGTIDPAIWVKKADVWNYTEIAALICTVLLGIGIIFLVAKKRNQH